MGVRTSCWLERESRRGGENSLEIQAEAEKNGICPSQDGSDVFVPPPKRATHYRCLTDRVISIHVLVGLLVNQNCL